MTSKKRFLTVCEHKDPDHIPINYMALGDTDKKVREFYKAESEKELLDRLGCDFYYLSVRDISQNETSMPIYKGPKLYYTETERTCPFGIRFLRKAYGCKFDADEAIKGPLENATSPRDILEYTWPKAEWFNLEPLIAECEEFSDRVIIGGFWSGILGDCYRMHGFSNFLLNLAMKPELIKTLVNRMTDFYLEINDKLFSLLKGKMDIYFFGNDYGSQNGLLFSEDMWLEFFYENTNKLADIAHNYGLKVMMHSCGSISDLIDHLINSGVDILDPVQTTAANMEPRMLKERFGDRIVFHGAIDTQHILPIETPENVYNHAVQTIDALGENGGYIFASCNSLQGDTPVENIDAMYRAAREYTP